MKTETDYAAELLGDGPADRLKAALVNRAKVLKDIDKTVAELREAVLAEGASRIDIRDILDLGGRPMKDTKITFLSGVDVLDRALKQLAVGNVIGGDKRDDKSVSPATCASLADYHEQIQALFERALAGETTREIYELPKQDVRA